jgi:hypothetical protein
MKLTSSFESLPADEPILILDVGSGSVGGALVIPRLEEPPHIAHTLRFPLTFQKEVDIKRMEHELIALMGKAGASLRSTSHELFGIQPKRACVVLASPWYLAHTHTVSIKEKESFTVSTKLIDKLSDDSEHSFKEIVAKREAAAQTKFMRIEQSMLKTLLNGYPTSSPHGKKAKQMEAALFISLVAEPFVDKIFSCLQDQLELKSISLHSFALLSFVVMRTLYPQEDDFLLIDIGGEVTNISLVRDSALLQSVSFSWGRNHLFRELARRTGTIPEEAHSLLRLASEGTEAISEKKTKNVMGELEDAWWEAYKDACARLGEGERLPKHAFLVTFTDTAGWFKKIIEREESGIYTFTGEPFDVLPINHTTLSKTYTLGRKVNPDIFLGLAALFVNDLVA